MANATGWETFGGEVSPSGGAVVSAAAHTAMETALQAEFVSRLATLGFNGVISGMTPTADGANDEIDIAAGVAFVEGYKAVGGTSIDLSGLAADDYYAYIDPTEANEVDSYKAKTTVPTQAELLLASFTWDGATTITNFLDCRQWGIIPGAFHYSSTAAISAATILRVPLIYPVCIGRPSCIVDTCGTGAGPTYVDVHVGSAGSTVSIWENASDRMTIAHDATDGAVVQGGVPDASTLEWKASAGDVLEIIVDAVATGATGLHVVVPFTYY